MIDTFTIRCNILHLAFSGKLTNQIKEEGTAKDILDLISNRKPLVSVEDGPYTLPDSWAWVRLKDLYKINPRIIADNDTEAAFIPMERISGGFDRSFTFEIQKWEKASKNHTKFEDGDIAFAKITPCFENRKSFIAQDLPNGIGGGTTELIILRQKEMLPQYTYYLVLDQRFISTGTASYKGVVGQQRVQSDVIKNYLVPVAPYSEQKRIVEKIEQAFSILDIIDELQAKYADNLTALKSKLIDAAIQGKLTKQLPEDGTAEELYQQIQTEKNRLSKIGKTYREKGIKVISDNDIPYDIPDTWRWVRLGDLTTVITKGSSPSWQGVSYTSKEEGILFVTSENVGNGKMILSKKKYIEPKFNDMHPASILIKGDILTNLVGASIGRTAVYNEDIDNANINQAVCIIRLVEREITNYLLLYLGSTTAIDKMLHGSVDFARANLSLTSVSNLMIPLPPLAEQKRIVQKLDEILPLCE